MKKKKEEEKTRKKEPRTQIQQPGGWLRRNLQMQEH